MTGGLPPSSSQRRGPLEAFFQQAASTGFALFILPGGPVVFWTLFLWLASSRCLALRALVLAYGVWMWFFDTARLSGERSSRSVRGWRVWRLLAAYFPASLHATAPLPPGAKYVMGYHPHGVVSLGAFVGVGTNGVGLDDAFPGLDFHLCTLAVNFKMPFIRELILRLGIIPASKACIRRALARNGGAVCIAVGGAKEALLSTPGAPYELYLGRRKGFVREALLAEASLVPTFAFGELDVFRAPARGSRARRWLLTFQNWGLGWYGYSLPVFCGNLPFTNVGFGLQPISEAVHIVTGAPIPHDGVAGPVTDARVDAMHTRYVAALRALFDAHKGAYAPGRELLIK